jgi:hypothetical protein
MYAQPERHNLPIMCSFYALCFEEGIVIKVTGTRMVYTECNNKNRQMHPWGSIKR